MHSSITLFHIKLFTCFVSFFIFFSTTGTAQECEQPAGRLVSIQGGAQILSKGKSAWDSIGQEQVFCPGDMLRITANSRAAVVLPNEIILRIDQKTTLTFPEAVQEKPLLLKVIEGVLHIFSHRPRALQINTPFVNGAVEGTEFLVQVDTDQAFISVFRGLVVAANEKGRLDVSSGQSVVAKKNAPPQYQTVVRPRDAVHWTLYYPVIIDSPTETDTTGNTTSLLRSASNKLSIGRVEEAQETITGVLKKDPANSEGLALQAIIAVVQNNKEQALTLANRAVEAAPQSAAADLALSYAQQAYFDVHGALTTLEKAALSNPDNALVKSRLAELYLSVGELDQALSAAREAVNLDPDIGRTQTVLGFAHLTRIETEQAQAAFRKALSLDQALPLARLGLGLAMIRNGDLEEGRAEIEIAAALDPSNAMIRSYLGKAYYEEKRNDHSARQYETAKALDPSDSTPWLYDAIRKQTVNRPVEALHDLQQSIALNDNRAVYRSQLLLDEDLAARSASLGRIYTDLGFQKLALVTGWKSLDTDPTNFSAHRLLADSYAVLPRHEIARVSELLLAQLLQPINITPIQPALTESNLFLISGQGPATASFNTFNPLFNRNQVTLQASGFLAENKTWGGEGIVSSIYNKLSLSAGYTHFETDGWRKNAYQNDDIANFFAQYQLSHKTSFQAEYRYRENDRGDTALRFFEEDFAPNLSQEEENNTVRLGFHHVFFPGSDLIGNFSFQNAEANIQDSPDPIFRLFDLKADVDAHGGELQYLFRSQHMNIVGGAGYFKIDSLDIITTEIALPFGPVITTQDILDSDANHTNAYLYSNIDLPVNVTLTVGASGDFLNNDDELLKDQDQFNPKFGITWTPVPNTTFRAAAFKVLKRTLITDQTLEPTQVAGFNQFFDEINATDYWRYGGAIDQKFSESIYAGAEYTYRDLNVPFTDNLTSSLVNADWEEKLFRAYLFWTPHNYLALSAEYLYEDLERDQFSNLGAKAVETNTVPLGINFFHPSGLSASFKGTYIDQSGSFNRLDAPLGVTENGQDDFWLFDAAIRYRLPKRYGFFVVGVNNLTDENFKYFDTDPENPSIQPDRVIFTKITLALP